MPVSANSTPFTDISSSLYYDAIEYVYNEGIMNGTTSTTFEPNSTVNRAMAVTILYRISGSTAKWDPDDFTDVPSGAYYYYAVGWAQAYGIVNGVTETTFCPTDTVTIQQFVTFLYRYATEYEYMSYNLVSEDLVDLLTGSYAPSNYAKESVNWAMNCGILPSTTNSLNPRSNINRGLCAEYLHRFMTLAFGDAKAFAMSSLSISTTDEICEIMCDMGYDATYKYDLYRNAMKFAFYNSTVIYTHSHGGDSCIQLKDGYLYATQIDEDQMSDVDLVYVSACQAGGTFANALYYIGGANAVVGFTENISATTDTNGIHYFNKQFFTYLNLGYSLTKAKTYALRDIENEYGAYSGADSIEIYGYY